MVRWWDGEATWVRKRHEIADDEGSGSCKYVLNQGQWPAPEAIVILVNRCWQKRGYSCPRRIARFEAGCFKGMDQK